jgi:hypothetical protein
MEQLQWDTAEKLRPDVIVLFAGPFADLAEHLRRPPTVDQWYASIRKSAGELREADPGVRLAVSIDSGTAHAQRLFARLREADSPVDIVGFSLAADRADLAEIEGDLENLADWCERNPGPKPLMIFETWCSPRISGGERGQWNFLSRVVGFADGLPGVQAVCIGSLYDLERDAALISWAGRMRLSYRMLQASPPR